MGRPDTRPTWTFLTHHARVLILIARDPGIRLREVAAVCEVTERTVQAIVADLEDAGYLTHRREGRRNRYQVIAGTRFRHPAEAQRQIAGLLALINGDGSHEETSEADERADRQSPDASSVPSSDSRPGPSSDSGASTSSDSGPGPSSDSGPSSDQSHRAS